MRFVGLWLVVAAASVLISGSAISGEKREQDYWMGIYYGKSKIGSLHVTVAGDRANGAGGWIRKESLKIRFRAATKGYMWNTDRCIRVDGKLKPISDETISDYKDTSRDAYRPTTTKIRYGAIDETITTIADGTTDKKTQPLTQQDRALLAAGNVVDFGGRKLSVGDKFDVNHYRHAISVLPDPSVELNSGVTSISVLRRESIRVGGAAYDALVVSERGKDTDIMKWQLNNGEIVKQEIPECHILYLREDQKIATQVDDGQGPLLTEVAKSEPAKAADEPLHGRSPAPLDYWMGVYSKSVKMGDLHVTVKATKLDGKDVFYKDEMLRTQFNDGGKRSEVEFTHMLFADRQLSPILETLQGKGPNPLTSKPQSMLIEMRYAAGSVSIKMTVDGKDTTQSIPLSDEDRHLIDVGCAYDFGVRSLVAGDKIDLHHMLLKFRPDLTGVDWEGHDVALVVRRREKLKLNGMTYDALVLSAMDKSGYETITWRKANGEVLKEEAPQAAVTLVQETKEHIGVTGPKIPTHRTDK